VEILVTIRYLSALTPSKLHETLGLGQTLASLLRCGKLVLNGDSMALRLPTEGKFKRTKFKALVHYICWRTQDNPARLGATKLNKILWYAETGAFLKTGKPLTGARYVKRQHGPVPACIPAIVDELAQERKIFVREPYRQFDPREFISLQEPDIDSLFVPSEIGDIDRIIDAICDAHTATSISLKTHNEPWRLAELGEDLPIFTVLATPAEITEADMKWADRKIAALKG
jgi:hypothetical protein